MEKATNCAQLLSYTRWSNVPGPIELWTGWSHVRHSHFRFFALQGKGVVASKHAMGCCLQKCLSEIEFTAPAGGKYTSHSLMIGAHTEQVLTGLPLEARLARFSWVLQARRRPISIFIAQYKCPLQTFICSVRLRLLDSSMSPFPSANSRWLLWYCG